MKIARIVVVSIFILLVHRQKLILAQRDNFESSISPPDVAAKWQHFVQSLGGAQRAEFERLHQEAGQLDSGTLAQRIQKFTSTLSAGQKKEYAEIQQRRNGAGAGTNSKSTADDRERQRIVPTKQAEPTPRPPVTAGDGGGGRAQQGFVRWINNPELSMQTRDSLRRIKEIFARTEMDPVKKCEKIQHILQGIGTADKKQMKMPSQLLTFDCAQEGHAGAENLVVAALSSGKGK